MFEEKLIKVNNLPLDIKNGECYEICQGNPNSLTHSFFKYPCKFIPEIPAWAIKKFLTNNGTVYDPFCGSGTTILETVSIGCFGIGSEIDNFAKLLTKVKCTKLSEKQIQTLTEMRDVFSEIINNKKSLSKIPVIYNIEHWFPKRTIEDLGKLLFFIESLDDENIRDFLKVCFASIIKKVSFCDSTSPKPYVSNRIKKEPPVVAEAFLDVFDTYLKKIQSLSEIQPFGSFCFTPGDAIFSKTDVTFDLAFTSPPYINAFDYGRTLRLENLWLGFETEEAIKRKKKDYVGTEKISCKDYENYSHILNDSPTLKNLINEIKTIDLKRSVIVLKFFDDMKKNLIDVHKHLKKYGVYGVVIGDSEIRKILIPSAKIISEIAINNGYEQILTFKYIIKNPYIRIPRNGNGGLIKYDNVLILRRN